MPMNRPVQGFGDVALEGGGIVLQPIARDDNVIDTGTAIDLALTLLEAAMLQGATHKALPFIAQLLVKPVAEERQRCKAGTTPAAQGRRGLTWDTP